MGRIEDRHHSEPPTPADHDRPAASPESSSIAALRHRHLHGLHRIVDAYRRADDSGDRFHPIVRSTADPVALIDEALAACTTAAGPHVGELTDGEIFLRLCVLLRTALVGDATPEGGPGGLLEAFVAADRPDTAERRCVLDAFGSLEERDRVVLWFVATEGALPARLATLLASTDPDTAATTAYRARSRLRRAYARRRVSGPDWPEACVELAEDVAGLTDGSAPQPPDATARAHLRSCTRCTQLSAESAALPTQLAVEAAAIRQRGTAPTGGHGTGPDPSVVAREPATEATKPLVISTTPLLDEPGPAPAARTGVVDPTLIEPPEPVPDRRRTGTVVGLVAIFVGVVVALVVWLSIGRSSTSPATPGDTIDAPGPDTTTHPTTDAGLGVAPSTAAPGSTVTLTVPPSGPPTTGSGTASARPTGPASSPAWSPPRTAASSRPSQSHPPSSTATPPVTTQLPPTAPPTTVATTPSPSTSIGGPPP